MHRLGSSLCRLRILLQPLPPPPPPLRMMSSNMKGRSTRASDPVVRFRQRILSRSGGSVRGDPTAAAAAGSANHVKEQGRRRTVVAAAGEHESIPGRSWLDEVCDTVFYGRRTLLMACLALLVSLVLSLVSGVVGYMLLEREMDKVAAARAEQKRTARHFGDRIACEPCYVFLEAREDMGYLRRTVFALGIFLVMQVVTLDHCRFLACVKDPHFATMRIMAASEEERAGRGGWTPHGEEGERSEMSGAAATAAAAAWGDGGGGGRMMGEEDEEEADVPSTLITTQAGRRSASSIGKRWWW